MKTLIRCIHTGYSPHQVTSCHQLGPLFFLNQGKLVLFHDERLNFIIKFCFIYICYSDCVCSLCCLCSSIHFQGKISWWGQSICACLITNKLIDGVTVARIRIIPNQKSELSTLISPPIKSTIPGYQKMSKYDASLHNLYLTICECPI